MIVFVLNADRSLKDGDIMICERCKANIADKVKFCPKCGARVEMPQEEVVFCPKCKTPNPKTAKFCKNDGTPLDERAKPEPVIAKAKEPEKVLPSTAKNFPIWIVLFALIAILAGVGGYLCFFKKSKDMPLPTETSGLSKPAPTPGISDLPFNIIATIDDPDGYVNVRSMKSSDSDVVARVYEGEEFHTYLQKGNWWQVMTKDGKVGYMHTSRIKIKEKAPSSLLDTAEFLCPDSDKHYLTESDLTGKTPWKLTIMRNEIYARHGRPFKREDLQDYFNKKPWYRVDPNYTDSRLNEYERKNVVFIKEYQKRYGKMD